MDLLLLNSYCSPVALYEVHGTYTKKLISITNGEFFFCHFFGGKNTRFERDSLQKLVDQIIKYELNRGKSWDILFLAVIPSTI